jgi:serine acetyltransferase
LVVDAADVVAVTVTAEAVVLAALAAEAPVAAVPAETIEESECKRELLQRRARLIRLQMIKYSRTDQPPTTSNP